MANVLNFRTSGNQLIGVEGAHMYLGSVAMHVEQFGKDAAITEALRDFNLPNTRAPGDWPETTVRGTCSDMGPHTARRARWGHD